MIFLDTSAIYALADRADENHRPATDLLRTILLSGDQLLTHNYVLVESMALLQHRLGLKSALQLADDAKGFELVWIGRTTHDEAVASLRAANRRQVSLVDAMSFMIMREHGIEVAFAFDPHFVEQGFRPPTASPPGNS